MKRATFLAAALVVAAANVALAQLPTPELDTIYPPGGQAGKSVDVALTGTDLDDLTGLRFSHEGISAEQKMLPADEIWPEPRPDGLKFTINIAENVPTGLYEVRTVGKFGISTPRFFAVSAKEGPEELTVGSGNETPETAKEIALNQVVNAITSTSRSDHYKLKVAAGQRVLVHVWGERIDSRIDAMVSVLDPTGATIAESLNEIGLDPMGDFTAEAEGEYIIKVADYLFTGGGQYFYRLMASTAPHIDGVFPPAGQPGTKQKFTIYGRNIPGGSPVQGQTSGGGWLEAKEVEIQVPTSGDPVPVNGLKALQSLAEGFEWKDGASNSVRIGLAKDKIVQEDPKSEELTVELPCEVAGRFNFAADMDLYRFTAKAGETYYLEVICDRMAVGADPNLIVQQILKPAPDAEDQSEKTKFIAESDDIVMTSILPTGFANRTRDVGLKFTAPADGEYRVIVGNNFSKAGPLAAYRLGIRPARPGFQLLAVADKNWQEARNAMPGVPTVNAGGSTFVRVLALRHDGFDGAIELTAAGLPPGVVAPPAQIWKDNDEAHFIVTAAANAQDWIGEVEITGKAKIGDREVSVKALPGTLTWSATDTSRNRIRSRLTGSFPLVVKAEKSPLALELAEAKVYEVELQKQLDIPVKLTKGDGLKGNVTVTPYGLPNFTRPPALNIAEKDKEGVVKISFRVDGNNRPMASEGKFVLKVDGVMGKYKTNPEAVERWTAWQKVVNDKATKLAAAKVKADAASKTAAAAQTAADKAVTDNATQHAALVKATAAAQAKFDAAKKAVTDAEAALKAVPAAVLAAAQKAVAANSAAKPGLEKAAAAAKAKFDAAAKTATQADAALTAAVKAHEEKVKNLTATLTKAEQTLKTNQTALATAEKALADFETARVPLANKAADAEIQASMAKKAAAMAEAAIASAATAHEANIKALTEAKTKAEAALKAPEAALAKAKKTADDKKTANATLAKTAADAQTKFDAQKKAAADADAAIKAKTAAHAQNLQKLNAAKAATAKSATDAETALAAANKAVAANKDEAKKPALAKTAADAKAKVDAAKKAAAAASKAVVDAEAAHKTELAKLAAAKTRADAGVKTAQTALTNAQKAVATGKTQLAPLETSLTAAQAKFDEAKKAADDATAAIAAAEKANTENVAKLTANKAETAKVAQAAEATFTMALKPLTDHDTRRAALEKAVTDASAKIEPAQKAVAAAKPPIQAAETAHAPNLAKLTKAKNTADLAKKTAEMVVAAANQALAENTAAAPVLAKAVTDAQAAVDAANKAAADKIAALTKTAADSAKNLTTAQAAAKKAEAENAPNKADLAKAAATAKTTADAAQKALTDEQAAQKAAAAAQIAALAKLTVAKTTADTALKTAATALAAAKKAQAENEAAKSILTAAAAAAKAKAAATKQTAAEATRLDAKAKAAKTLAAAELKKATDRAKEKDVKFTVFSQPIALKIVDPKK